MAVLRRLGVAPESFDWQKAVVLALLLAFSLRYSLRQRDGGSGKVVHVSYWNLLEEFADRWALKYAVQEVQPDAATPQAFEKLAMVVQPGVLLQVLHTQGQVLAHLLLGVAFHVMFSDIEFSRIAMCDVGTVAQY